VAISDDDLERLRRCVELAREALNDGDEPFDSILVDAHGVTRYEDRNRVKDGDHTRHPEFAIARWAVGNLTPGELARATVAARVDIDGPARQLADPMKALYAAKFRP
jgi:tRNA(Arg) A34 adenosine deaminase TadA